MKLSEFFLDSYKERSLLISALEALRTKRPHDWNDTAQQLLLRLSRTECQAGGCPYCNADRAREEAERHA